MESVSYEIVESQNNMKKMKLEITNRILVCPEYISELERLTELENERIFCRHDMEHFLSVARITLIMCIEKGIAADPDVVYSAALLHDIGRTEEYTNGIPHEEAGIRCASAILDNVNCGQDMKVKILSLIENHREKRGTQCSLEDIFYNADKKSRMCFCCSARSQCNWAEEKRNMDIEV